MFRTRSVNLQKQIKTLFSSHQSLRTISSDEVIERELKFGAHNYDTVPVALCRGKGISSKHSSCWICSQNVFFRCSRMGHGGEKVFWLLERIFGNEPRSLSSSFDSGNDGPAEHIVSHFESVPHRCFGTIRWKAVQFIRIRQNVADEFR